MRYGSHETVVTFGLGAVESHHTIRNSTASAIIHMRVDLGAVIRTTERLAHYFLPPTEYTRILLGGPYRVSVAPAKLAHRAFRRAVFMPAMIACYCEMCMS